MGHIVVVGSLNQDVVITVPHLPVPGETVLSVNHTLAGGGKGANQAFTCGRLGAGVTMLGSVGKDEPGRKLLDGLATAGVAVDGVQRIAESATGRALIAVEPGGRNSIIVLQGANLLTDPAYVRRHARLIEEADIVLMQLEIPLETVRFTAHLARRMGKRVILDPAPAPDVELPADLLANVDIIKPNEVELARLTGRPARDPAEAERAARDLLARGVGRVVATMGEEGALIVERGGTRHIPARVERPAVDTTAAGDSFVAAMAVLLTYGYDLEPAVRFATEVAAIVVSRPGAQPSIPGADEVAHLIPRAGAESEASLPSPAAESATTSASR